MGLLPSSFGCLIVLEKGHFCSNAFNGIHMKLSVKLSNSLSKKGNEGAQDQVFIVLGLGCLILIVWYLSVTFADC